MIDSACRSRTYGFEADATIDGEQETVQATR